MLLYGLEKLNAAIMAKGNPNTRPPNSEPPAQTPGGNRGRRNLNIIFVGLVAFLLILSVIIYAIPTRHTITTSFSHFGNSARWDTVVYLDTDVLSAQTEMRATAYALPRNMEGKDISVDRNVIFIYFPNATWWNAVVPIGAVPNVPYINLTKQDDGSYLGTTKKSFSYDTRGDNGIVVSETWLEAIQFPVKTAPAVLPISGEDVKYQHDSNRAVQSLTLVAIALGVATSYSFVARIVFPNSRD